MSNLTPQVVNNVYVQKTFKGGMDTLSADTQVPEDAYVQLINGRARFGGIKPVNKHIQITGLKGSNYQGCVGLKDYLIVFIDGLAFYKKEGQNSFTKISSFQLSSVQKEVFTCAVPVSSMSFVRYAKDDISAPITLKADFKILGTPACVVCQDGSSRPQLITYDSGGNIGCRPAKSYAEWQNRNSDTTDREYVPAGREMFYLNGKLFIVSPEKTLLYHSITGRPLDFMVNVDSNGNKKPLEADGKADTVAYAFDYDEITCIRPINTPDSFIVGTRNTTRVITLDYDNTVFGEPTYSVSAVIEAGIINNKSFVELTGIGDYAFIDFEGVIAFNAVQQLRFNGRNSIFSLVLSKFLTNIKQKYCACVNFDNYSLFSIKTNYGYLIAVFDLLLQKWISLDITEVARVKQFAITDTETASYLYCVTEDNKVFQMYAATTVYPCMLRTRAFATDETVIEHKAQNLRCMFNGGTYDGSVTLIEFVDERESDLGVNKRITRQLPASVSGIRYPVIPPVIPNTLSRVDNTTFILNTGLIGKKLAYILRWTNDAELVEFELTTTMKKTTISSKETNATLQNIYA